jgi:hypothetical protein
MPTLYNNNAFSTLAAAITSSGQTSVTVQTGHGDRFPIIVSPDVAFITLENTAGTREVIKITARASASDVLTVTRGEEGTSATTWAIGDLIEQRITAGELTDFRTRPGFTTTATSAGTLTLTKGSTEIQTLTGSTTHTVVLPVVSTLYTGKSFTINNNSTGIVTVNSSGSNAVVAIQPGNSADIICVLITGTTAASWTVMTAFGASNGALPGTLSVTGATTLLSTLAVTGATTLSSTLGVTGATSLSSTLAVTGITTIANGTVAAPSLVFAGDADSGFFKGTGASILAGLNGTEVLNINTSTFDVKGALACNFPANVSIVGALSKGSGSFRIAHPLPALNETHDLVHSFIEGPQADLIYRGRVALVDGKATVNIDAVATMSDGTFETLCRDVQCFTSNETDWSHVRGFVAGNILTIECQDTASIAAISWMVIGERQDKHMMDTTWTDDNGKVIVEPLKPIPPIVVEEDVPQYTGTTHKDIT